MVRDINGRYITPLTPIFPANRKGVMGDPWKVNCLTCHQGASKPLAGVKMLADYPYMRAPNARPIMQAAPNAVERALDQPGAMTTRISPPNAPTTVPPTQQQPLETEVTR
jgi:photosynthetic reaction center cytochrome c subunit